MFMSLRARTIVSAVVALGLLATACGGGGEPKGEPAAPRDAVATPSVRPTPTPTSAPPSTPTPPVKRGGTLRLHLGIDPTPWNILRGPTSPSIVLPLPVLNTLVQTDFPGNTIVSDLAERWTVREDGKEIVFNLARGVAWHDGRPLVAGDIKFNLDRVFFGAGGFSSFLRGFYVAAQSVDVVSDSTLRITLRQPSNSLLANMTHPVLATFAPHVADEELERGKLIGTGPFVMQEWRSGVSITMGRNPSYFRKDQAGGALPYLDGLQFFIIPDPAANLAAFRTGRIDVFDNFFSTSLIGQIQGLRESIPGLESGLLAPTLWRTLHLKNEPGLPFANPNVRRALQFGLDRQRFVDAAWQGIGYASGLAMTSPEMGGGWAPPLGEQKQLPGNDPAKAAQDQAAARDLLAKAGYGPENRLKFEVAVLTTVGLPNEMTALAEVYRPLNVEISIKTEDVPAQARRLQAGAGNFEALYRPYAFAVDDPSNTIGRNWLRAGPNNYSGWSDPQVEQWYQEQDATPDPARRAKLVKDILLRLYDQALDIVVAWNTNPWVKRPDVRNYTPPPPFSNGWRYEKVWIDR